MARILDINLDTEFGNGDSYTFLEDMFMFLTDNEWQEKAVNGVNDAEIHEKLKTLLNQWFNCTDGDER